MEKLTVYGQMIKDEGSLFSALKNEINMKTNCIPFALKVQTAFQELYLKSDQQRLKCANAFLSSMQTITQQGLTADDYDVMDFVPRDRTIVASTRVEGLYRACARKGYRIVDTIIGLTKEDANTTFFEENILDGNRIYILKDQRNNPDRIITADRIIKGYFEKFICRLEITEINTNKITTIIREMSNDEILKIQSSSDNGFFETEWVEMMKNGKPVLKQDGTPRKEKVQGKSKPNSIWNKWTPSMVEKSIIRRAMKRVKEILPALTNVVLAFEEQDQYETEQKDDIVIPMEDITIIQNIDLNNLTTEQKQECKDLNDVYKANPKFLKDEFNRIKSELESGEPPQDLINMNYCTITCIKARPKMWGTIKELFRGCKNA